MLRVSDVDVFENQGSILGVVYFSEPGSEVKYTVEVIIDTSKIDIVSNKAIISMMNISIFEHDGINLEKLYLTRANNVFAAIGGFSIPYLKELVLSETMNKFISENKFIRLSKEYDSIIVSTESYKLCSLKFAMRNGNMETYISLYRPEYIISRNILKLAILMAMYEYINEIIFFDNVMRIMYTKNGVNEAFKIERELNVLKLENNDYGIIRLNGELQISDKKVFIKRTDEYLNGCNSSIISTDNSMTILVKRAVNVEVFASTGSTDATLDIFID